MRFIKYHRRILRQDAAEVVLLEGEVRKKQMMIYDDQIRFFGALLHSGYETLLKFRTFLPRAGIAPRVDSRPQLRIVGQKRELGAVSRFGQLGPLLNLPEGIHLFHALEDGLLGNLMQFRAAQKVGPPLHHRDFQLRGEVLLQKWNIFLIELLLQGLSGGGNDDATPAADRR